MLCKNTGCRNEVDSPLFLFCSEHKPYVYQPSVLVQKAREQVNWYRRQARLVWYK